MSSIVFALWYEREYPDREDTEISIGIFSTRERAEEAITRLVDKPGFCEDADGFKIYEVKLDQISWEEGFFSSRQSEWREDWGPKTTFLDFPPKMRPTWTKS